MGTFRRTSSLIAALVVVVVASGCGSSSHAGMNMNEGASKTSNRTVDIDMIDVAFKPSTLPASKGETVKFVFHNKGKVKHEAVFGDAATQDAHESGMGSSDATHDMANMNEVNPGLTDTVSYTFDKAGTTIIGCHETGHYAAGMKVIVTVS